MMQLEEDGDETLSHARDKKLGEKICNSPAFAKKRASPAAFAERAAALLPLCVDDGADVVMVLLK